MFKTHGFLFAGNNDNHDNTTWGSFLEWNGIEYLAINVIEYSANVSEKDKNSLANSKALFSPKRWLDADLRWVALILAI